MSNVAKGSVSQVMGPVVDVAFDVERVRCRSYDGTACGG